MDEYTTLVTERLLDLDESLPILTFRAHNEMDPVTSLGSLVKLS